MPSVLAYHRPENLEEAAILLAEPNRRAVGGGTVVVPQSRIPSDGGVEIVDLQSLGLDRIEALGERVTIGAMVRLGDLMLDESVPALLRDLARRELPSALRNQATVGGTVALGDGESVLLAGLLAHDAQVETHTRGSIGLADHLANPSRDIIIGVSVAAAGAGVVESVARTPADVPIVSAVARMTGEGVRVVLTGVGPTPVLVDPTDPASSLNPPADFRGSVEYRKHLAMTVTARAVGRVKS
ncbi:MAG: hypothetical protein GY708_03385 [Actinomycetia bacterium]|nr:hypothetical protein [Actinomycetes bacterium]